MIRKRIISFCTAFTSISFGQFHNYGIKTCGRIKTKLIAFYFNQFSEVESKGFEEMLTDLIYRFFSFERQCFCGETNFTQVLPEVVENRRFSKGSKDSLLFNKLCENGLIVKIYGWS